MNNPNSSSLFHFTRELNFLKDLISNGFRYSYSYEKYPQSIIRNNTSDIGNKSFYYSNPKQADAVAIPMICFCDIRLSQTSNHCKNYGSYAIGINKEMARTIYGNTINPIHYLSSSSVTIALSDISVIKDQNKSGCNNLKESINTILALSKPYEGTVLDDGSRCFYDEKEWRIFLPDNKNEPYSWKWEIHFATRDEFKKWRDPLNQTLIESGNGRLTFLKLKQLSDEDEKTLIDFFTHIIVGTDAEVPELVDYILNRKNPIFGYKQISAKSRRLLVSKISSMERIYKDF